MPSRPLALLTTAVLATGLAVAPVIPSSAAPAAHEYKNCTEIHKHWSGGIAKAGVHRNKTPSGSRALKGTVKHDTALYNANRKSDRDKDGVACEQS